MCQYSAFAENTRDAEAGEDLVVSRAPHNGSNWLTTPGASSCAVCIPDTAMLAVQLPNQNVRGVKFIHDQYSDPQGNYDFLQFVDGEKERVPLNGIPIGTGVRVLSLGQQGGRHVASAIPKSIPTTVHVGLGTDQEDLEFLTHVGAVSTGTRGQFGEGIRRLLTW